MAKISEFVLDIIDGYSCFLLVIAAYQAEFVVVQKMDLNSSLTADFMNFCAPVYHLKMTRHNRSPLLLQPRKTAFHMVVVSLKTVSSGPAKIHG
jgi:hypothetical protein